MTADASSSHIGFRNAGDVSAAAGRRITSMYATHFAKVQIPEMRNYLRKTKTIGQ